MDRRLFQITAVLVLSSFLMPACKVRSSLPTSAVQGSVRLEDSPPKVVYHFGQLKYLRPIGRRAGTFTDAEWQPMPSVQSNRGVRAGFYTTQHPAYSARYENANRIDNRDESPWMMTVTLRDECRQQGRWLDVRAVAWQFCKQTDFDTDVPNQPKKMSGACENEIASEMARLGVGVVRDFWWDDYGYWYVADKDCIEALDASPEGFVQAASALPEFWRMTPYESNLSRTGQAFEAITPGRVELFVLARSLYEGAQPSQETLQELQSSAEETDIYFVRAPLIALTRYAAACGESGGYETFRRTLGSWLAEMVDVRGKKAPSHSTAMEDLRVNRLPTLNGVCNLGAVVPEDNPSDPKALAYLRRFPGRYKATRFGTREDLANKVPPSHVAETTLTIDSAGEVTLQRRCQSTVPCDDFPRPVSMRAVMGQTRATDGAPFLMLILPGSTLTIMVMVAGERVSSINARDYRGNVYILRPD